MKVQKMDTVNTENTVIQMKKALNTMSGDTPRAQQAQKISMFATRNR